jgi:hypothetical protein
VAAQCLFSAKHQYPHPPIVIAVLTLADSLTPQHSSTEHAMLMEKAHLCGAGSTGIWTTMGREVLRHCDMELTVFET